MKRQQTMNGNSAMRPVSKEKTLTGPSLSKDSLNIIGDP